MSSSQPPRAAAIPDISIGLSREARFFLAQLPRLGAVQRPLHPRMTAVSAMGSTIADISNGEWLRHYGASRTVRQVRSAPPSDELLASLGDIADRVGRAWEPLVLAAQASPPRPGASRSAAERMLEAYGPPPRRSAALVDWRLAVTVAAGRERAVKDRAESDSSLFADARPPLTFADVPAEMAQRLRAYMPIGAPKDEAATSTRLAGVRQRMHHVRGILPARSRGSAPPVDGGRAREHAPGGRR